MTGSPGDEIVVSLGPPDSKKSSHRSPSPPPLPPTEPVQSADEPMPDAEASPGHDQPPQQDEVSRKSFKRKYRKLLNKYLTIRATNQTLHQTYELAVSTASQLSNENAYILDYVLELNPATPPSSPPAEPQAAPPSPTTFNRDAHFGYSPTPEPPAEAATQLTQEQIDMGMIKVHNASTLDMMGPPTAISREGDDEAFKARGGTTTSTAVGMVRGSGARGQQVSMGAVASSKRKRKDRDSEVDENAVAASRKKSRG